MPQEQQHPWGESKSQNHSPVEITQYLERQIENLPEAERAQAVANIQKATADRNAMPGQILKTVVGIVAGLVK